MSTEPYLPTRVGFEALNDLDQVNWSSLHHAYGQGVVGSDPAGDVAGSLALLRQDPMTALNDGLWSNICHQGTVYEATAYALPFIAAVAAGNVATDLRSGLCVLLGAVAIAGSYLAPTGSSAGSYDDDVETLIRQTLTRCSGLLDSIEKVEREYEPLIAAIRVLTNDPSDEHRSAVDDIIEPKD